MAKLSIEGVEEAGQGLAAAINRDPVRNLHHRRAGVDRGTLHWHISEKSESETEAKIKKVEEGVIEGRRVIQEKGVIAGRYLS